MKYLLILPILYLSFQMAAQEEYQMKGNNDYMEVDFLTSYYGQKGDNAAVTGGIGTEKLGDLATILVVNVPFDSIRSVNISIGVDYYTSASTDNIDANRSSASRKDTRTYGNLSYSQKNLKKGFTYGGRLGFSTEYDYGSFSGGVNIAKEFNEGNTELSLSAQAFLDRWSRIYPEELRGLVEAPAKSRRSYNAQFTYAQVLSKKLQIALSAEAIYMNGLLSTPFHRVYFADQATATIENLPLKRLKIPLSIRATYSISNKFVLRSYYRYYYDDFGIYAHTASLEVPIKITKLFTISPFYRYHTQTASDYFAPFAVHTSTEEYYSSDYDLSELSSQKYGIGLEYSPIYGMGRMKIPFTKKILLLQSMSLRGARYTRSTGLRGFSIAFELKMRI